MVFSVAVGRVCRQRALKSFHLSKYSHPTLESLNIKSKLYWICAWESIDYNTVRNATQDEMHNETAESDQIKLKAKINIAAVRIELRRRVHFMSVIAACSVYFQISTESMVNADIFTKTRFISFMSLFKTRYCSCHHSSANYYNKNCKHFCIFMQCM